MKWPFVAACAAMLMLPSCSHSSGPILVRDGDSAALTSGGASTTCLSIGSGVVTYGHFFLRNTTSEAVRLVSITPVGVRRVSVRGILMHPARGDLVGTAHGFPPDGVTDLRSPAGFLLAPGHGTAPSSAEAQVLIGLAPRDAATEAHVQGFRVVFTTKGETYQMISPQAVAFRTRCGP
jgi:hypothetical protein